jgi:aryl-alcohol dehydrogenase-like predicted oxidoreductase
VDLVLTGPRTAAELRENLAAVGQGPLSAGEIAFLRELGAAVHG